MTGAADAELKAHDLVPLANEFDVEVAQIKGAASLKMIHFIEYGSFIWSFYFFRRKPSQY